MEAITILVLLIIMVVFATLYWSTSLDRDLYKELSRDSVNTVEKLTRENINLKLENLNLKDQLVLKSMYKQNNKPAPDKDILEAVKYAMKKAHPQIMAENKKTLLSLIICIIKLDDESRISLEEKI